MPADVYLVLLEFGQKHEQEAVSLLDTTLRRVFSGARLRGVVVDNALSGNVEFEIERGFDRVSGDNTHREFSGWDRGIRWLEKAHAPAPDAVFVLANDTVVRDEKHARVRDILAERAHAAASGAMVGWVDAFPRPFELFGYGLRQWIDTSFLITERRTLDVLGPLARPIADDSVFADDWRRVFREPSPLSENYRAYLRTWLFGEPDDEFSHGWYAQEPLAAHNFEAFKAKLRCIFREHLLSAEARRRKIPFVDIRAEPLAIDPF